MRVHEHTGELLAAQVIPRGKYDTEAANIESLQATIAGMENRVASLAHKIEKVLTPIKGLTSISKSWDSDFSEIRIDIDTNLALSYGLTPAAIVQQIPIRRQVLSLSSSLSSMSTQYVRNAIKLSDKSLIYIARL